jgi:hypothetical protein
VQFLYYDNKSFHSTILRLVESMIYQLKYKGQQEIGIFLGNWMGSY